LYVFRFPTLEVSITWCTTMSSAGHEGQPKTFLLVFFKTQMYVCFVLNCELLILLPNHFKQKSLHVVADCMHIIMDYMRISV